MNADRERYRRHPASHGGRALRWAAYALAGIVLLGACALTGLRLLLPEIGRYKPEIESWLSRTVERPVEFAAIEAYWRGWTPEFRFSDVRLGTRGSPDGEPTRPWLGLADLTFSIDPIASLRTGTLQPRGISASGASLVVVRKPDGTFAMHEHGKRSPAAPEQWAGFVQWVLNQTSVSLFSSRIVWIDEMRNARALPLTGAALHLERVGERYSVSGSFELPDAGRIDFALELDGDSLASSWSGEAYATAHDVDLTHAGLDARRFGAEEFAGVVSGAVWSTWEDARLVEAEGTVRVRSPSLVADGIPRGFDEASASFRVKHNAEGWTLLAEEFVVSTPRGLWPASSAGVRWSRPREDSAGEVVVHAEYARIEDIVALAAANGDPPAESGLNALVKAGPRGSIEDIHVSAPVGERIEIGHARARGRFAALDLDSEAWPVSVDAARGQFEASREGMVIEVAAGNLQVSAPRWLTEPLRGKGLAGVVSVFPAEESVRVRFDEVSVATPAGNVAAQGWLLSPRAGGPPELNVDLALGPSRVDSVRGLMAERALPAPVARWLESAVPFGDVREARLTFRGRLSDEPLVGGGDLAATVELAVPVFSYARGWPVLSDVSAVVRIDGTRLDANVSSGRFRGSDIRNATVVIDDMKAEVPVLRVEGRAEGTSTDAARFVAESPLRARFEPAIDTYAIRGACAVDLRMKLPLKGRNRKAVVEGEIVLDDNRIDVPGFDRGPEEVNGTIAFGGEAVASRRITATWFGESLHATLGASPASKRAMRLSIDGRVTRRALHTFLRDVGVADPRTPDFASLLARVDGDAALDVVIDIPRAGTGNPVELQAVTDLAGISLDLPPPLDKAVGTVRRLGVDITFARGVERIAEVRYGDLGRAVLRFVPDAGRLRLERGEVVLGGGGATLPDAPGLTVGGTLSALDAGAWQALLEDMATRDASRADATGFDRLREVTIEAHEVAAIGARFPATRIRATRAGDGGWRLDLQGSHLEGEVRVPPDTGTRPVVANFERFVFDTDAAESEEPPRRLDPRTLPALSFSARHFILGDLDLGQVAFTTIPSGSGMSLERLDVQTASFDARVTGGWSLAGDEHRTEFVLRMHGDDLGEMLGTLGFDGKVVTGAVTDISLRGAWAGTPAEFGLERLTGVMRFLSTDGRLTRLEPGVTGRVFGLLTITSLPRRLILDFSDLFRDGFEFDRIEGSFAIENGNAYTDDLFMESGTARFDIVGRTGLAAEDYDQLVTVIPKISSSLPLIPLWLAQKILNRNVFDKAFSYQYTITGTWSEPAVEFVRTERRIDDAQ